MSNQIQVNERTAVAQKVENQPDGPGRRIEKRGELTIIAPIVPGSGALFRSRLPQFQAEAAYWEGRVGTVEDFRLLLIDNDTRLLFSLTYDGDFKPYLEDIAAMAGEWLDGLFLGVVDGYKGLQHPETPAFVAGLVQSADFFYVAHPDVSVRDVQKLKKVSAALTALLDAAS